MIHAENTKPFMPLGPHKGITTWSHKANIDRFTMTQTLCLLHRLIPSYVSPMLSHSADVLCFCKDVFNRYQRWQMWESKLNQRAKNCLLIESQSIMETKCNQMLSFQLWQFGKDVTRCEHDMIVWKWSDKCVSAICCWLECWHGGGGSV